MKRIVIVAVCVALYTVLFWMPAAMIFRLETGREF